DHAVFIFRQLEVVCMAAWHVDDGLGGSNNKRFLAEVKHRLHLRFGISDMGPITKYLGIQFERDRHTRELWLHQ
ncbi:hypothetical protein M404DRAFT_54401, partial [Pisolithus tinctorius Marx 270]